MSFDKGIDTTYRNKNRVRGGSGKFNWDQLRGDRQAAIGEFHLGRSQMCEDIWYARAKQQVNTSAKDDVKSQEEDMMREALGLKPVKRRKTDLSAQEEEQLLKREHHDDEGSQALGLGLNVYTKKSTAQFMENTGLVPEELKKSETFALTGVSLTGNVSTTTPTNRDSESPTHVPETDPLGELKHKSEKKRRKAERKEKKKAKKREKKERRRAKKHERKRKHSSDSDDSSSCTS